MMPTNFPPSKEKPEETQKESLTELFAYAKRLGADLEWMTRNVKWLLDWIQKPLALEDAALRACCEKFSLQLKETYESIKDSSLTEIKQNLLFVSKRLVEIEKKLDEFSNKGVTQNIALDFRCEGYSLVKKPKGYEKEDPVLEEANDEVEETILKTLFERERLAVIHRLGLFGFPVKTYAKLGTFLKVSPERARQIFKGAERKMRHPKRSVLMKNHTSSKLYKVIFG